MKAVTDIVLFNNNRHYSFKLILLFHFGFTKAASELGFKIIDNSVNEAV
jgi:hypothetical protein